MSLLYFKKKVKNLLLVFVKTDFHSKKFLEFAQNKSKRLNLPLKIINLKLPSFILENNKNRCYFCKNEIFLRLKKDFNEYSIVDGTNYSDTFDFRPGLKALKEHNIYSPFKELKISKKEIINYLEQNNLKEFISLPTTCLATRIVSGLKITPEILKKIDTGEKFLTENGIYFNRLRVKNSTDYTIETLPEFFPLLTPDILKKLGKTLGTNKINITGYALNF